MATRERPATKILRLAKEAHNELTEPGFHAPDVREAVLGKLQEIMELAGGKDARTGLVDPSRRNPRQKRYARKVSAARKNARATKRRS